MEEIKRLIDETFLKGEEFGVKAFKLTMKDEYMRKANLQLEAAESMVKFAPLSDEVLKRLNIAEAYIRLAQLL